MKNRIGLKGILAIGVAAAALGAMCAQATAQAPAQQGRGQGRGARGATLISLPAATLETTLKLTTDQKTKVSAIREKYTSESAALRPAAGQPADPANTAKLRELTTKANQDVEAILTDEQKKTWEDARKEIALYTSAGIPIGLYGDLKLTDEQKTKLEALQKETAAKTQGLSREERRTAMQEARTKAAEVLTAEQKSAIEKYNKEHPRRQARP